VRGTLTLAIFENPNGFATTCFACQPGRSIHNKGYFCDFVKWTTKAGALQV
jgi:hypothetical protein